MTDQKQEKPIPIRKKEWTSPQVYSLSIKKTYTGINPTGSDGPSTVGSAVAS